MLDVLKARSTKSYHRHDSCSQTWQTYDDNASSQDGFWLSDSECSNIRSDSTSDSKYLRIETPDEPLEYVSEPDPTVVFTANPTTMSTRNERPQRERALLKFPSMRVASYSRPTTAGSHKTK